MLYKFCAESQTDKDFLEKFLRGIANIVHRNVAPLARCHNYTILKIGLFHKKFKQEELGTYFVQKTPRIFRFARIFRFVTLPLEILQNCVTLLENPKCKNQDPSKFHMIFSQSPLEISILF